MRTDQQKNAEKLTWDELHPGHASKCAGRAHEDPAIAEISCDCDGYHTFGELYEHRYALFLALARKIVVIETRLEEQGLSEKKSVWWSLFHADGTMFDGMFIMGIGYGAAQVTYHLPVALCGAVRFATELPRAPEWDGHTSDDVVERLGRV